MTAPWFNMVKMAVVGAPGVHAITLGLAVPGYQTFADAGANNGDVVSYSARDNNGLIWEVGHGVYLGAGPNLTRGAFHSSDGTTEVYLSGSAIVWSAVLAEDRLSFPFHGTTAARPVNPAPWTMYGDTDLGLPVWWTGTVWINAIGAPA